LAGPDPRRAAFRILKRIDQHAAWSGPLLQALDAEAFAPRDLALANELTLGTLRRARSLDAVIASLSSRRLERIDPDVRIALRLGLYQILFLDRIPPHAAVNETVKLAGRRAGGFVNALLRRVLADMPRARGAAQGEGEAGPIARISVAESYPPWLVARWVERFGESRARSLMQAQNRPAPVSARVLAGPAGVAAALASLRDDGLEGRPSALQDDFIRVDGAAQRSRLFVEGGLYIQDEASALVARLAGVRAGDRVLDVCAAPGGKAFLMAQRAGPAGVVFAFDRSVARLADLRSNARRMGVSCPAAAADPAAGDPFVPAAAFDVVMVDAPCSGTGVIRRNPEARERVTAAELERMVSLQARLLEASARRVRPGGALVYSVCSLEPEEGERQVESFLERAPSFRVEEPGDDLVLRSDAPYLMTFPDRDDLDGFFAVRLRRQGA
jgi:16S rRNA (cytosine967-C5)-methyltransferase